MKDLRDAIHQAPPESSPDAKVFLEYHLNSPWALAKVKAGMRLTPEAVDYMQRQVDERTRAKADYETKLAEEMAANDSETSPVQAGADAQRDTGTVDIRGPEQHAAENS